MKTMKQSWMILLLAAGVLSPVAAQQVSTLYFLENAPMRHQINPAFQPVSDGYVNFTPLGYTSMWVGNNSLTMSDAIFNQNGQTVTAMHPDADRDKLMKQFRKVTLVDGDITMDLLSFGFRHKDKGYIHIGIMERIEAGVGLPDTYFDFLLDGGMRNLSEVNTFDLKRTSVRVTAYTEFSGGYSYKINDQWTVGGKVKFLLGTANATMLFKNLTLDASAGEWHLYGEGAIQGAAPIRMSALPNPLSYDALSGYDYSQMTNGLTWQDYLVPQGYGAGIDVGFTYKPHPQVQITAALNDLGFIVWKGVNYSMKVDSTFTGVNDLQYSDYANASNDYKFDANKLGEDVVAGLQNFAKCIRTNGRTDSYTRMLAARLNVGVDANFCNNILGVGIVSKTRLFNNRLYEEVTIGGAVRPCNWFNFAVSYSLVNNGKYSNIGAGLSFMPYDGINMTLAMDYIPTSYVEYKNIPIPYKSKGVNVALGFSIVWGTNPKKDADKDGVPDKWDLCPETPKNVLVDSVGCPRDEDGDGVPDYLDLCPGTPKEAHGMVDSVGCPVDSDGDGVPDYRDYCFTMPQAIAFVDSLGCDADSDGDGVPDYRDSCFTVAEGRQFVDSLGCDKDSDGDGVPDYIDKCLTMPEAKGFVDSLGCNLDTDNDGVDDYLDECPHVAGPVENKGCPVIKKEVRTLLKKAMQGIQFETGKAVIKKSSNATLDQIAKVFIANPDYLVEVQGHTDNTGSDAVNLDLSQRRADAVKDYLVKAGVPQERLKAVGYGPARPIADNSTKSGRALNRRVEFIINFEEVSYETILDHAK